jgi:cytochrome c553
MQEFKSALLIAGLCTFAALNTPSRAEIPTKVKTQCQACHGLNGVASFPGAPHLSGQPVDYLVRTLKAYRSGERRNEQMSVVSKDLTDKEIKSISEWYANIQVEVQNITPQ